MGSKGANKNKKILDKSMNVGTMNVDNKGANNRNKKYVKATKSEMKKSGRKNDDPEKLVKKLNTIKPSCEAVPGKPNTFGCKTRKKADNAEGKNEKTEKSKKEKRKVFKKTQKDVKKTQKDVKKTQKDVKKKKKKKNVKKKNAK